MSYQDFYAEMDAFESELHRELFEPNDEDDFVHTSTSISASADATMFDNDSPQPKQVTGFVLGHCDSSSSEEDSSSDDDADDDAFLNEASNDEEVDCCVDTSGVIADDDDNKPPSPPPPPSNPPPPASVSNAESAGINDSEMQFGPSKYHYNGYEFT